MRVYEQCLVEPEDFEAFQALQRVPWGPDQPVPDRPAQAAPGWFPGCQVRRNDRGLCGRARQPRHPHPHGGGLYELIRAAHRRRMDVAVHAIGDLALQKVCDAVGGSSGRTPGPRPATGWSTPTPPPPLLERMKAWNLQAYIQPIFIEADMEIIRPAGGGGPRPGVLQLEVLCWSWDLHISGGSDCPVEPFDILDNLRAAVTRQNRAGTRGYLPGAGPHSGRGLRLFTYRRRLGQPGRGGPGGTLEVGRLADLVVLDGDLFHMNPADFPKVKVVETVLNGKTVFRA